MGRAKRERGLIGLGRIRAPSASGFEIIGGRTRTRTLDPLIKSQLLYQLSYAPALSSRGPPRRGRLPKRRRAVHPWESRSLGPRPEERGRQTARLEGRPRRTASRPSLETLASLA